MKTKLPANQLKGISFPECHKHCAAAEYFGVGECESVCTFKFKRKKHMRADIYWRKNLLTYGADDPHLKTKNEGFHATLQITTEKGTNIYFRVPESQYDEDTAELIERIKNKINGD